MVSKWRMHIIMTNCGNCVSCSLNAYTKCRRKCNDLKFVIGHFKYAKKFNGKLIII